MLKIKNDRLDLYGTKPSNSSNLEQLSLKGLTAAVILRIELQFANRYKNKD